MSACPSELELARALTDGADPVVTAHLAACATCRTTWDGTVRVVELARLATRPLPPAAQREELRTAILASSPGAPVVRRRTAIAGAAALAAAGAALYIGLRPDPPAPARHATIVPHAGARFSAASDRPDELVYLLDGGIDVAVTPLEPGERFRVVTVDAEVEVHGTAFEISAHDRRLASVRVHHGAVEVRPLGAPPRLLHAGDAWAPAPVKTASVEAPPAPAPPPPPPPIAATPKRVAGERAQVARAAPPAARPPQAIAYDDAWAALRANDFATASAAFARTALLDPDGPLAEDASYWYPVALARAKRGEAAGAFRDFLERYPRSPHAGEASAMLGWLLVDAGERAEAERRFRAALDAPTEQVRTSARAGLAALGVR